MRKPRARLGLVDPEPGQPLVNVFRDPRRVRLPVVEDEHADGARLPVPNRGKHGPRSALGPRMQRSGDRGELTGRPRAQERNRDMQVLSRDEACPFGRAQLVPLPAGDPGHDRVRQAKAEKEP